MTSAWRRQLRSATLFAGDVGRRLQGLLPPRPTPSVGDQVLVALLLLLALTEGFARPDLAWRPLAVVLAVGTVASLLWRRSHPFTLVVMDFGLHHSVRFAASLANVPWSSLFTSICLVLLPYSLVRRSSSWQIAVGLAVMLLGPAMMVQRERVPEAVAATVLLLLPAMLGAVVRLRASARQREIERAKHLEREQLARELHDTVAHHVSAIVVQAQAGRTLSSDHREPAARALEVIEEAAARALGDMRSLVRTLRYEEQPQMAPLPVLSDLKRLARNATDDLPVEVQLSGDLEALEPTIAAAMYRLVQESITNAIRHARGATHIAVSIVGEKDVVRLVIRDDGRLRHFEEARASGFGLAGMAERASLLGGTFRAGPNPERGWTVEAVLPRKGAPS
ncbi:MAG: sensor histidine kinase [Myxococcota bacterium]